MEKTQKMVDHLAAVNKILEKYDFDEAKLIPILQEVQEEYKYLSKDVISYVANSLDIPPAKVYGVATFYAHFSLKPKGKYIFKLCDGTACHVKKSHSILEALYNKLELSEDKNTSDDMLFTVETVSCLGACGLAPVMVVNEEVYGQVTPQKAEEIVDEILEREKSAE
ncbi:NAD(P)H-dependent oxidoreductase subunit E [Lentisphaerota bacterium ZTH]|nr:NAD(P)H-dependent oxidoreductase subunit E [Lentisphaerota bacterium]WET07450.1 NAD(P)H-dependent oxidoreductase subunit E [Lentisphaerota bacterium ZTH]